MDFVNWVKAQRDRVVAWVLIAIGGACIVAGWIGVTNTTQVYDQLTYIVSGAIVGLFFLALGIALLLSADFHDEWRKLDRIEAALRGRPLPDVDDVLPAESAVTEQEPVADGQQQGRARTVDLTQEPMAGARRGNAMPMMAGTMPSGFGALPIRQELTWAAPGVIVAMVLIAIAWIKSNSTDPQVGADALLIAVYGVFAVGGGLALHSRWLRQALAQRKDTLLFARRKDSLLASRTGIADDVEAEPLAVAVPVPAMDSASGFFVAEGGRRYHRAGCAVVASQRAVPATPAQLAQLIPCRLCDAERPAGS
jgi:hypothetical protein